MSDLIKEALSFDDVMLEPAYSEIMPSQVNTKLKLANKLDLHIPLISAAMDTVTEYKMAIGMAQYGGIGIIHKNCLIDHQAKQVDVVKKFHSGVIVDPLICHPNYKVSRVIEMMKMHKINGVPVIDKNNYKVVGIITRRDLRFAADDALVSDVMVTDNLVTVTDNINRDEAIELMIKHKIERLIILDKDHKCKGLVTAKGLERSTRLVSATEDTEGRLAVGAAIGTDMEIDKKRAAALIEKNVDILAIDTAHGHSRNCLLMAEYIKKQYPNVILMAGNIVTKQAAQSLLDVGVDMIKVGIGSGSICTTRIVTGVGVPQFSAVLEVADVLAKTNVNLISDGGIRYSGDCAKVLAAGADACMIGSLFAGTNESPGETKLYKGRSYKFYRGMGSMSAMMDGSNRYDQVSDSSEIKKMVPEGVESHIPYKGPVSDVIYQLIGGIKSAMGYTGSANIKDFRKNALFRKITSGGYRESHVHDVILKPTINYNGTDSQF